jgi:tetratricopeptide (TPR) repeat protein
MPAGLRPVRVVRDGVGAAVRRAALRRRHLDALIKALQRSRLRARVWAAGVAMLGIVAIGAGAEGYRRWDVARRVAACATASEVIDRTWNDEARQTLRDAFVASGVVYAETAATKVIPWLDRYVAAWKAADNQACLYTEVEAAWDADTAGRAQWCLDERRIALSALVAEFDHASETSVQKSVAAAAGLPPAESCVDPDLLRRQPPPPSSRELIEEIRGDLVRGHTLGLMGENKQALEIATAARERAEAVEWPSLWAAARAQEGRFLEKAGMHDKAEEALKAAYFKAAQTGAWEIAAKAALSLVQTIGVSKAQHRDGHVWADHAAVAISYAGDTESLLESHRLNNIGLMYKDAGAYKKALEVFERALTLREQAQGPGHPDAALVLNRIANVHQKMGTYKEALALLERARSIREQTLGPHHPDVIMNMMSLGNLYHVMGDDAEALILLEQALRTAEQSQAPDHPGFAVHLNNLGNVYNEMGAYARAIEVLERAVAIREQALGLDHPLIADSLNNLSVAYDHAGQSAKVQPLLERGLRIKEKALGLEHPDLGGFLNNLAAEHLARENYAEALALFERALKIKEKTLGPEHTDVAVCLNNIAGVYMARDEFSAARPLVERSLALREKTLGPDHPLVASALGNFAILLKKTGAFAEAQTYYERAIAAHERAGRTTHPELANNLRNLANLHVGQGRPRLALPLVERAVAILDATPGVQFGEAAARFQLAKVLVETGGDRERALVEARKAADGFREAGPAKAEEVAEVTGWVARQARRRR